MASTKHSGLSNSTAPPPPPTPRTMSGKRLAESSPMKTTLKFMPSFFSIPTPTNSPVPTATTTAAIAKPRASSSSMTATKPASKSKSTGSATTKAAVIDWQLHKPEVIRVEALNIHYTSLRDIMPTAMLLQCKQDPSSHPSSSEVINVCCGSPTRTRMKNHLVEQAARAYLQPLNLECNKSTQFFPWNWQKLMGYTPLTFGIHCGGYGGSIKNFFSSFTKISLSRTLRYLLGRVRPNPMIGFLQKPRIR